VRSAALAFVLGLFLVYGLILLRDALDTRVRDSDDLAKVTGLPVLAEFPRLPGGSRRLPREASSYLRTNVMFATTDAHPAVILVTSPQESEGKSSVALSLAESFARNDHRTLLVDADLRKPVVGREYGLDPRAVTPLRTWLDHPIEPPTPAQVVLGSGTTLDVIPSFEPAPAPTELLGRGFLEALEGWRKEYDVIVIDSAPVLPVADTLTIAPLCTGTLLVASADGTDRRRLKAAVTLLQRIGVRVLGSVATNLPSATPTRDGYGYGYGYGYGATEAEAKSAVSVTPPTSPNEPSAIGRS
jgi:capsular exopolysaccharide synthesis family protein